MNSTGGMTTSTHASTSSWQSSSGQCLIGFMFILRTKIENNQKRPLQQTISIRAPWLYMRIMWRISSNTYQDLCHIIIGSEQFQTRDICHCLNERTRHRTVEVQLLNRNLNSYYLLLLFVRCETTLPEWPKYHKKEKNNQQTGYNRTLLCHIK